MQRYLWPLVWRHGWTSARKSVRRRDKWTCQHCGRRPPRGGIEVNHIVPRNGGGYRFGCWNHHDNLETLCHDCHVEVSNLQRKKERRPPSRPVANDRRPPDRLGGQALRQQHPLDLDKKGAEEATISEYIPSPSDWVAEQVELYEGSLGTEGLTLRDTGLPVIIVTNRGRKTDAIRKTPLMRAKDGNSYILVASRGGAPKHPLWYHNLKAEPNVEIRDKAEVYLMRVREVVDSVERQ